MNRRTLLLAAAALLLFQQAAPAEGPDRNLKGRVLILGATGRIGPFVAEVIAADGYTVRATSRNPARARERFGDAYEWVHADVRDPRTLVAPVKDVDYVVSSIRAPQWAGPYSPEMVDYHGMRNLVDAAQEAGVKHFVLISTATSGPQVDQSRNPAKNYVRYFKTKGEQYLRESGMSYTIIAPGRVPQEDGGKVPFILVDRKDYFVSRITAGDIGIVALDALTNPEARGKAFAMRNEPGVTPDHWRTQYAAMPRQ
jgi:uncharacterized protein YbjT (DUF2867 family)